MREILLKGYAALFVSFTVWLLLSPLSAQAQAEPADLRIGVLLPLSGTTISDGNAFRRGISKAQKEHPDFFKNTKVIYEDSHGSRQAAISGLRRLIDLHRVHVVLTIAKMLPQNAHQYLAAREVPVFSAMNVLDPAQESEFVFQLGIPEKDIEHLIASWMRTRNCKRPRGLLAQHPSVERYAQGLMQGNSSFEVLDRFSLTEFDYRRSLVRVSNPKIDCLFVAVGAARVSTFLKYLREVRSSKKVLLLQVGGDVLEEGALTETRPQELVTISHSMDPSFRRSYDTLTNDNLLSLAHGYELMNLLVSFNAQNSKEIIAATEKISNKRGAVGHYSYYEKEGNQFLRTRPRMRLIWKQKPRRYRR